MFITFEGIDGCGKTTVARAVAKRLRREGARVLLTCEPTNTWLGDAVKKGISEGVCAIAEAFLFMADRAEHTEKIRKMLSQGYTVISDRYMDSTCAYQAVGIQKLMPDINAVSWLMDIHKRTTLRPDITFLLIVPVDVCLNRIKKRDKKAMKFERRNFLIEVERNYKYIAKVDKRVTILDADRRQEEIVSEAMRIIRGML